MIRKRDRSRPRQVYEAIKTRILKERYRPREPLVEEALARDLCVSRTPVREALKMLARDGLVEILPYKGAFVSEVSAKDIQDVFIVREAIEGVAARECATRAVPNDLDRMAESLVVGRKALESADHDLCVRRGYELHEIILEVVDNKRMFEITRVLRSHIDRFHRLASSLPGQLEVALGEHEAIVDAIRRRDPDLAENRMREHIRNTGRRLLAVYTQGVRLR